MAIDATLTEMSLLARGLVTLLDQVGSLFAQRLGNLPAALRGESTQGCEQQSVGQEQRQSRHRFRQSVEDIEHSRTTGSETRSYQTMPTVGKARRKIYNGLVGSGNRGADGKKQHRAVISNAGCNHAPLKQVCDIIAGTQDVGNDQLKRKGRCDIADCLGDVNRGVIGLGEQQRDDNCPGVAGLGQSAYSCTKVWLRQVKVRRHRGELRLLGNGCHEPLDVVAGLGMPAAVGKPD